MLQHTHMYIDFFKTCAYDRYVIGFRRQEKKKNWINFLKFCVYYREDEKHFFLTWLCNRSIESKDFYIVNHTWWKKKEENDFDIHIMILNIKGK